MAPALRRFRWRCSCGALAPGVFTSFRQAQDGADDHYATAAQIGEIGQISRDHHSTQVLAQTVASERRR